MTGTEKTPSEISDFKEHHTDITVSFTVTATKEKIDSFEREKDGFYGKFKLSTTISTNNMNLFDVNGKIHKYKTPLEILKTFFCHRLGFYIKRKAMLLEKMKKELNILVNKVRFVEEVCQGDLVVSNRKRTKILAELNDRGYDVHPKEDSNTSSEDESENDESVDDKPSDAELSKSYEYLLGMKIWNLTFERAEELRMQRAEKTEEVEKLKSMTPEDIWLTDLDAIDKALNERDVDLDAEAKREMQAQSKNKARVAKNASTVAKKARRSNKKVGDVRKIM